MYGQIVLANTKKGLVPSAIRFFTSSKFSHSLVTLPDTLGVPMCIEASSKGISTVRFETAYLQNPHVEIEVWDVHLTNEEIDLALIAVLNHLESSYGYSELPWFVWRWFNKKLGRDIKHENNWFKKDEICSELCEFYLMNTKLRLLFTGYGDSSMCPQDIRDVMVANPMFFTLSYSNMGT